MKLINSTKQIDKIISEKILEKLNKGEVPWRKTWVGRDLPYRYLTSEPYQGINLLLLEEGGEYLPYGEYLKIKENSEQDIQVKKGIEWVPVIFSYEDDKFKWIRICHKVAHLKYFEGLSSKLPPIKKNNDARVEKAENIIRIFIEIYNIELAHSKGGNEVSHRKKDHFITIPNPEQFDKIDNYYLSIFHELIHVTGDLLKRKQGKSFGDKNYSLEELIAEIGAWHLANEVGLECDYDNSIAYLQGWYKQIKNNPKLISIASNQALKAVDLVLNKEEMN